MLVARNESWLSHNESINYALSYEHLSLSSTVVHRGPSNKLYASILLALSLSSPPPCFSSFVPLPFSPPPFPRSIFPRFFATPRIPIFRYSSFAVWLRWSCQMFVASVRSGCFFGSSLWRSGSLFLDFRFYLSFVAFFGVFASRPVAGKWLLNGFLYLVSSCATLCAFSSTVPFDAASLASSIFYYFGWLTVFPLGPRKCDSAWSLYRLSTFTSSYYFVCHFFHYIFLLLHLPLTFRFLNSHRFTSNFINIPLLPLLFHGVSLIFFFKCPPPLACTIIDTTKNGIRYRNRI